MFPKGVQLNKLFNAGQSETGVMNTYMYIFGISFGFFNSMNVLKTLKFFYFNMYKIFSQTLEYYRISTQQALNEYLLSTLE